MDFKEQDVICAKINFASFDNFHFPRDDAIFKCYEIKVPKANVWKLYLSSIL